MKNIKYYAKALCLIVLMGLFSVGSTPNAYAADYVDDFEDWGLVDFTDASTGKDYSAHGWRIENYLSGGPTAAKANQEFGTPGQAGFIVSSESAMDELRVKTMNGNSVSFKSITISGFNVDGTSLTPTLSVTGWRDGTQVTSAISVDYEDSTQLQEFDLRSSDSNFSNVDEIRIKAGSKMDFYFEGMTYDTNPGAIPAPTVTSILPTKGSTSGGTSVTVNGTNFAGAAVNFGGTNAATVNVVSNTQLVATSPAHTSGTVDVTVLTGGGTSATSAADRFTYNAAPTITTISPNSGSMLGGDTVTVTGTNFTDVTSVTVAGTVATFTVNTPSSISFTTPASGTSGAKNIVVTTDYGTATAAAAFTYIAPHATVEASAATPSPTAGVDNLITLTVKNSQGNTDTSFTGSHNVQISGYQLAPDGSTYGSFGASSLSASPNTVILNFVNGVASANLKLNKAAAQSITFSVTGVSADTTNTLSITPVAATKAAMVVTTNITAPASNGANFAQQPVVKVVDAFGNTCLTDQTTVINASKKDGGTWTLTGTTSATVSNGVATFTNLGASNGAVVNGAQIAFDSSGLAQINSTTVNLLGPAGHVSASATVANSIPVAGADNVITISVKNSQNVTDTSFTGSHDVTISGYVQALDGSTYGTFDGTNLVASPNTISLTFTNGVATAPLRLNRAVAQTIGFSVADVDTPATNTVTITPVPASRASMTVTTDLLAPATNNGAFARQPVITLKDTYGNICTNDNATVITASKKDGGTWNLTGTTTATASSGVATFSGLGANNTTAITNAQLAFDGPSLTQVTSAQVNLPAPAGHATVVATASVNPVVAGETTVITITVKDTLGNTDPAFTGNHNVTISGYSESLSGSSYGELDGHVLTASPNTVAVNFVGGVASVNLKLNKAVTQSIGFSVADVDSGSTNNISLGVTAGAKANLVLDQLATAPSINGGQFAQQPKVKIVDAFGNLCTSDSATVVTASKKDGGTWVLTGNLNATAVNGVATFTNLGATNSALLNTAQLAFDASGLAQVTTGNIVLPAPSGHASVHAVATTLTPVVGADDLITLTVKDTVGNTDTSFTGAHNVSLSGYLLAPDGFSYGHFNGTALTAGPNTVSLNFTNGVATANLKLDRAGAQNVVFSVAGVDTPQANTLAMVPVHGVKYNMTLTQNVTAPTSNGGQFAQQPRLVLKDIFGNLCDTDNSTLVTVAKKDSGSWTLTGTSAVTASSGVINFSGLGATNTSSVSNAQLAFDSATLAQVTSATMTLPAPSSGGGGGNKGGGGSSGGGSSSSGTSGSQTGNTTTGNVKTTTVEVVVNGKTQNAGTASTETLNNQTVSTVKVDAPTIQAKLASEGNNATVEIPIKTQADVVVGQLDGQTVKLMENSSATLVVRTSNVSYTLPAEQINIDAVSDQIGTQVALKDIKVNIKIEATSSSNAKIIESTASRNQYQVVVKPVDFEITCTSGNKTVEVSQFNGYVERLVAIPDGVDPSKITTGIVLNQDGSFAHVPTSVVTVNGKAYAKINSLTNSTYSVIWNPITFADVANHWAKGAVNDMASRLIMTGADKSHFLPDQEITRAEFIDAVVKGLGLMRTGEGKNLYSDVKKSDWYYDAITIANKYGIASGYDNGKFGPNDKITREQAMVIIGRAMKISGISKSLNEANATEILKSFSDIDKLSNYAKISAADCVKSGLITGKPGQKIAAKDNITRAEVAVIVQSLLKQAKLIS